MNKLPQHFWAIHKKVYNREWLFLDKSTRRIILADRESEMAAWFYKIVMDNALRFFLDEEHNYNSRHRFQYAR
jgi:hypothetical protein